MKKLLCSAAVCGLALAANPAQAADGLTLELGGYMKGYMAYVDQDEDVGEEVNDFDIIRNTEIHFGGETTLDNGLTVGVHFEEAADVGDGDGSFDESYAYFSGGWGRVNFGAEDGASYLLQVEAPSADDNIDGLRQYVQPVNYDVLGLAIPSGGAGAGYNQGGIDYDQDVTGKDDKITYLSPIMNGFQAGVSFTPDSDSANELGGIGSDDVVDAFGRAYELALRYEGQFNNVGVILGAGYTHQELEEEDTDAGTLAAGDPSDDREAWNVGADFDIGPFGLGAAYTVDSQGEAHLDGTDDGPTADEEETLVVGVDYTTGPFKIGASYLTKDNTGGVDDLDTDRYSGGVTYTYGPGMTFRGSVGVISHEPDGADEFEATYVTLGTQINF